MMKHKYISFFLSTFLLLISGAIQAQTMVTTKVQTRNFLIEKGTGQVCSSCPTLDDTCLYTVNSHPDKGILIEYHVGPDARYQIGLADYTTPHGDSLYNSLPFTYNMMVNRHDQGLPWGYTYIYNQVQGGADAMIADLSDVNLAMNSSFNKSTRELTVNVEAYYTSDSKTSKNYLNIALTEDSLISKQTDSRVTGLWVNNYNHMHVFRTYLTGMWGDTISTTSKGTLVTKQYKYTMPSKYKDANCHLIFFMTEEKHAAAPQAKCGEIINAVQSPVGGTAATGIEEIQVTPEVVLYPNPSTGLLNFNILGSGEYYYELMNINGTSIYKSSKTNASSVSLDLSNYSKGLYFVRMHTQNGVTTHKVLLAGE